ncbi:acetylornithine deacetylase or succinyl-diaminopimelate desuccinylase [Methanolacinia petrolearia DSM 11571]|uniref:Probable succinyl-diaminopimelate desuccinylase n=1 Tax=Methanolacinia petrolearia (strain DSM 11571 / OCM 486 / SEBR 4847) TaxID=679926 RepID=E1RE75_METP4|nr:ArgE/DapE family deacylase [Methanolacinia petrolearia]ADN36038.1 acetylornithine deacetylase or succinyl-diaminopimelate desuccinylase [Methanolacinia petrolearia DSM 11571]
MNERPDVVKLCSELVRIDSENPPGDTSAVIDYIQNIFENFDIPFLRTDLPGGKSNIQTVLQNRPLLLLGHVDVVPAMPDGWEYDPFSGKIVDGYIFGRGTADMKGGCAAIITAFIDKWLENRDIPANLCFVCDEESGGPSGTRHLIREGLLQPCDCLIAECTPSLHPSIGQKGILRMRIEFNGEPGHGSLYPEVGVSSIEKALEFVCHVREINRRTYPVSEEFDCIIKESGKIIGKATGISSVENILKKVTYNPGIIRGGERVNIVAQKCCLELEMRIPWGCSPEELLEELGSICTSDRITAKEFSWPTYTDENSDIVRIALENIQKVYKDTPSPFVQWAATDARFLRKNGFNVIEYGPGEINTLHGVNEAVSIEELKKSVEVYKGIIQYYTGE